MIGSLAKDSHYGAAIVAAPVVWAALYWLLTPPLAPGWVLQAPLQFLMLALVYPVLEEFVFRGLVQGWLMQHPRGQQSACGITAANVGTSLIFTALHFLNHSPLMAASVIVPSLLFGYFRDKYEGWLIPAIGLHCFYNAGYFLTFPPA